MAVEIKMPQLSDTMYSGKILGWRKKEGDSINRGDILAEVETDKANLEIESFHQGTLLEIRAPEGATANVGDVIAVLGVVGEKLDSKPLSTQKAVDIPEPAASSPVINTTQQPSSSVNLQVFSGSRGTSNAAGEGRIKASPLARKVAEQRNIELASIKGSGPNGRIVRKDIEMIGGQPHQTALADPSGYTPSQPQPIQLPVGEGRLIPFSKMRETIAKRMQESVREAPHFYVTTSVDMSQAKKLRELLKERVDFQGISINHLVIKAVAYGIEREPRVNNCVKNGQLFEPAQINIGIITAVDDGLLIPVIKDANRLSLRDIVFEARAAVERARAGRPNSTDLVGGTFSISNMGMFDVESFTAIINPGQGSVLAVSSIKDQPAVHPIMQNGVVVITPMMKVTISVDHRIIDGVMAGNFLKHFKEGLENPALLAV